MKNEKNIDAAAASINTPVCWMVRAPFYVRMKKGKRGGVVKRGFAVQTPKLHDKNMVKIIKLFRGFRKELILKGLEVRALFDRNGNLFW